MSDPSDYEAEAYYDEVHAQISKEAIENFTAERLRSFYDSAPTIAEKAINSLAESRRLLQTPHHTAAFIHAVIATEVIFLGVILKPIVIGSIHNDALAPLIVDLAIGNSGLRKFGKLLTKVFHDVSGFDFMAYKRIGGTGTLWKEIDQVQDHRNGIMHRAEVATKAEAEQAINVAGAVIEELFPTFAKSLGYHLHDGFRLCSDVVCTLPLEFRTMLERAKQAPPTPQS